MKKIPVVIILSLLLFVVLSNSVFAVSWWPLVPCGTSANPAECTRCDLFRLFKNIIDFVHVGLMPPVAAILFVWGGFLILMGGANPGWITQGRTIFWNTFMGVVILSSSWLITNTIINSLADESVTNPNAPWYQFECRETVAQQPPAPQPGPGQPPAPEPGPGQPPAPQPPPTSGATCLFSGVNLCQSRQMTCGASACNQYVSAINQYAGRTGTANGANFLKAVMIKESSCDINADSGHAYGLMQLVPSTANIYKSRCGVTEDITSTWLKDNPVLSICIAAEYMKALTQTSCGGTPRGVAAGYNGGSGACLQSTDCSGETSCAGGPVQRWECFYA